MKNKAQYLVTSTPITSGASMKEEILHMMGVLSHSCWASMLVVECSKKTHSNLLNLARIFFLAAIFCQGVSH